MGTISTLKIADAGYKEDMLHLLDDLRALVESGIALGIVTVTIKTDRKFHTRSQGDISYLEIAGYLAAAQLDALNAMKD